jgi:hypothetical protein
MHTRVVNIGKVRDLLVEWEKVRQRITSGQITGFQTVFCDGTNNETIFMGGVYRDDPQAGIAATLKLSAARMLDDDEWQGRPRRERQ